MWGYLRYYLANTLLGSSNRPVPWDSSEGTHLVFLTRGYQNNPDKSSRLGGIFCFFSALKRL